MTAKFPSSQYVCPADLATVGLVVFLRQKPLRVCETNGHSVRCCVIVSRSVRIFPRVAPRLLIARRPCRAGDGDAHIKQSSSALLTVTV